MNNETKNTIDKIEYVYLTPIEYVELKKISLSTFWRRAKNGEITIHRDSPRYPRVKVPKKAA